MPGLVPQGGSFGIRRGADGAVPEVPPRCAVKASPGHGAESEEESRVAQDDESEVTPDGGGGCGCRGDGRGIQPHRYTCAALPRRMINGTTCASAQFSVSRTRQEKL
jgi:hypothetical protein